MKVKLLILAAAAALVFQGCFIRCGHWNEKNILARVDKDCVTIKEFKEKALLYNVKVSNSEQAESLLQGIINDRLLLNDAEKNGIKIEKGELEKELSLFIPGYSMKEIRNIMKKGRVGHKAWLKDIKEKIIIKKAINHFMTETVVINEGDVRDYFWSNIIHFRTAQRVRAGQIVVETREKAYELKKMLNKGADFEELARKHSIASEAAQGGDLGYFRKKDMPAFIANEVFSLKEGKTSRVVKSSYGYHIFKVKDIRDARTPKFEDVRDRAHEIYFENKKDEYFSRWMKQLRDDAEIEIYNKKLKKLFKEENV
ncbi:MAG: peptidylprolyl isomerase [Candidatus Goldiibacteriota bacterium]